MGTDERAIDHYDEQVDKHTVAGGYISQWQVKDEKDTYWRLTACKLPPALVQLSALRSAGKSSK